MQIFTTVPILLGKPINTWLGLVLVALVIIQLLTGAFLKKGKYDYLKYHQMNATIIAILLIVHAYYGVGISFLGFGYGG
jgi:hypothetical protein